MLDNEPRVLNNGPHVLDNGPHVLNNGPHVLDNGVTQQHFHYIYRHFDHRLALLYIVLLITVLQCILLPHLKGQCHENFVLTETVGF